MTRISLTLASTLLLAAPGLLEAQKSVEWHADLAVARELAAKRHAPLFAVFRCER
ncbi:MAG: hypothetical protein KDC98_15325 [Planctomycetes bacterium]|nr:hypothetical protein [Planctomycetota bacterium]